MASDGGENYLCSVTFQFTAYYTEAFRAAAEGKLARQAYTGDLANGGTALSPLQSGGDAAAEAVQQATEKIQSGKADYTVQSGYAENVTVK